MLNTNIVHSQKYIEWLNLTDSWNFLILQSKVGEYTRTRYMDLPAWARNATVIHRLRNVQHWKNSEFRCFFTGLEARLVSPLLMNGVKGKSFPLQATIEHMVPKRHEQIHGAVIRNTGNEFLAIRTANIILSHKPLGIKLLNRISMLRGNLKESDLFEKPRRTLIDLIEPDEKTLEVYGVRPWNPNALENKQTCFAAKSFMKKMYEAEKGFLSLADNEKILWIEQFNLDDWI